MSRIRGRGNKDTELALAKLLRANGISGWRRQINLTIGRRRRKETHSSKQNLVRASSPRLLRVKPDFVFRRERLAVFVDGCFWHGCPKHATWPAHRAAWWRRKIEGNKTRDRVVNRALRRAGWQVVRIWEHELVEARSQKSGVRSQKKAPSKIVLRILEKLRGAGRIQNSEVRSQ